MHAPIFDFKLMQAYAQIEPFGSVDADYHAALIAHTIASTAGKIHKKAPKLSVFMRPAVLTKAQEEQHEKNLARVQELTLINNSQKAVRDGC